MPRFTALSQMKTGRRVSQRIVFVLAHAVGITARPAGEGFFEIVGPKRRGAPLVAVGAQDAAAIRVVEQHELADELVMIRCDPFTEDAEGGVAVALRQITESLVVGPVPLNDIHDVPDGVGLADALRHRPWRLAWSRLGQRWGNPVASVVLVNRGGELRQIPCLGQRHQRNRAEVMMRIEAKLARLAI